jgi:hypothetical protein
MLQYFSVLSVIYNFNCYFIWTDWGGTDSYKWTEKDRSKKEGTRKETTRSPETDNSCWLPSRDKKIWKEAYKEEVTTSNKTAYWSQCKYIRTVQCFGVLYWECWRFFVSFIHDHHSTIIFQNWDLVLSAPNTLILHKEWKGELSFEYTCFPSIFKHSCAQVLEINQFLHSCPALQG